MRMIVIDLANMRVRLTVFMLLAVSMAMFCLMIMVMMVTGRLPTGRATLGVARMNVEFHGGDAAPVHALKMQVQLTQPLEF